MYIGIINMSLIIKVLMPAVLIGSLSLSACSKEGENHVIATKVEQSTLSFTNSEEVRLYGQAFESVIWAVPMLQSMQMRNELRKQSGIENALGYMSTPPTGKMVVPTFNNTTPMVFGDISLKEGPVVLDVPAESDQAKFFGSLSNVWDRPIEDFGSAGIDQGKGGKFLLLPPGYEAEVPSGYTAVACDSYHVHFWLRSIPSGEGEQGWNDAVEYSHNLQLYPLAKRDDKPATNWFDISSVDGYFWGNPLPENDDIFALINSYVQEEVVFKEDLVALGMLKEIGIEKSKAFNPDEKTRSILDRAAQDAFEYMQQYLSDGKPYVPFWEGSSWGAFRVTPEIVRGRGSWNFVNYQDYHARAKDFFYNAVGMPARFDPAGGGATFYVMGSTDKDGKPLDGSYNYKLTVPANVPVKDFWSILLYSTKTRTYTNSEKFGLSSLDAIEVNDDGTTDVYIGPKAPAGKESNWLATVPGDGLFIAFRFYGPEKTLTSKSWKLNDFERVN